MITKKCIILLFLHINAKSSSFGTNCNLDKGTHLISIDLVRPGPF